MPTPSLCRRCVQSIPCASARGTRVPTREGVPRRHARSPRYLNEGAASPFSWFPQKFESRSLDEAEVAEATNGVNKARRFGKIWPRVRAGGDRSAQLEARSWPKGSAAEKPGQGLLPSPATPPQSTFCLCPLATSTWCFWRTKQQRAFPNPTSPGTHVPDRPFSSLAKMPQPACTHRLCWVCERPAGCSRAPGFSLPGFSLPPSHPHPAAGCWVTPGSCSLRRFPGPHKQGTSHRKVPLGLSMVCCGSKWHRKGKVKICLWEQVSA